MLTRRVVAAALVIGLLATAGTALAQSDTTKDKSIIDRLDDVGKTIFGGIFPSKSKPKAPPAAPEREERSYSRKPFGMNPDTDNEDQKPSSRAGSILGGSERPRSYSKPVRRDSEFTPEDTMPESVRREGEGVRPGRRPVSNSSLLDDEDTPVAAPRRVPTASPRRAAEVADSPIMEMPTEPKAAEMVAEPRASERKTSVPKVTEPKGTEPTVSEPTTSETPADLSDELPEPSNTPRPVVRPLHERLSGFRQSVFSDASKEPKATAGPVLQPTRPVEPVTAPAVKETKPALPRSATRPLATAQRPAPVARPEVVADTPTEKAPATADPSPATARANTPGVLFVRKGPVINVETIGPRTISVGREATYEVSLVNSGEVAAEELTVFVSLPEWAQIAGAEASLGNVQPVPADQAANTLQWKVGSVNAQGRERLIVRIVPRQSRPFDLAVRWESKPNSSQAMIEVQEPKLSLHLDGPKEVLYGRRQVYRLKLTNTGNGNAENVVLTLTPIGTGENLPASHKVGLLTAGAEKVLDVELVARQTGTLTIQADARGNGGVMAELVEKVNVRRAALKLDIEAPKVQFVGTVTTSAVRVRNTGTAAAKNTNLAITLPTGAKYLSGIEGARVDASGSKVEWTVENLDPQMDLSFAMKCSLVAAGMNRLHVAATAEDDIFTSAEAIVRVEAVANITLDVKDPSGPVALGEEAVYEVRVRNRGTKEAQGIEVFGYFSQGVEPVNATGAPNRFGEGQVAFQPIPSLGPGAEAVLKIHAKADAPGNHVFRAEARCRALNTRLIREATNLYYSDNVPAEQTAREVASPGVPSAPAYEAMRPQPRPDQGVQMLAPPPRS